MSTHFRPRATTPGPPSPTRPSTARSTIRAISPSPPPSLSDALRQDLATAGTPNFDSRSTPGSAKVRPKSDGFQQTYAHGFGDQETDVANYTATAENGNFGSSPANITANVTVKRGGGKMVRRSPAKRGSRSTSPKKRPYSTPTDLSSHREMTSRNQDDETPTSPQYDEVQAGDDIDSDTYADCPDTPTPMTNSQKRSAYLPLGTPAPFPNSKRSSKSKSKSSLPILTPATTPTAPTPKLEFFESFDEQPSHGFGNFDTDPAQTHTRPGEKLVAFYHNERRKMREGAEEKGGTRERVMVNTKTGYATPPDLPSNHPLQFEHPVINGITIQQPLREQDIRSRTYLAPPQQDLDTPLRKPVSGATGNVARHVSLSEDSCVSGGTVTSKRSVFSTPGRDELERKKALVENDDGPFAKAVSMADLNARRRVVSEEGAGGDPRTEILEAKGKQNKKVGRLCGLRVGCSVM